VDDFQSAGLRTITWDGKDNLGQQVPSGVYLYRIVARDYNQTRRMILMK
jgi:flagellar hook assembly protein FlgD